MTVRALSQSDDRTKFDCGKPRYNEFLQRSARQAQSKGLSTTYVADVDGEIAGFMTVTATAIVGLPTAKTSDPGASNRAARSRRALSETRRRVGSAPHGIRSREAAT